MDAAAVPHRMIDAGLDVWRLSLRMTETMLASQLVIGTRLGMIAAGLQDPRHLPHAEMARMWPEKLSAFGEAQAAATRSLAPRRASPFAPLTLSHAAMADGMAALDLGERMIDAALAWWQPLHARSTANARRLARRRR